MKEKSNLFDLKIRDHCRLTAEYRGAAHQSCNLNFKEGEDSFVPVLLRYFGQYDSHIRKVRSNCPS